MRPEKRPLYNESNVPSVSGGRDNPPDRYIAVALIGPIDAYLNAINTYADQGYRIAVVVPGYVLMGNYKKNK